MKVATTLLIATFCAGAVSAFGLHSGAASVVKSASRHALTSKAMVQAVDIQGHRLQNSVVSQFSV